MNLKCIRVRVISETVFLGTILIRAVGTAHGFASRPNLDLLEVKAAYESALEQTVAWFKKTLGWLSQIGYAFRYVNRLQLIYNIFWVSDFQNPYSKFYSSKEIQSVKVS